MLTGCGSVNVMMLMKKGEVDKKVYKVQVPFTYRLGLVVIKVKIDDTNYNFLIDSGAINLVSKELAKKLKLKTAFSQEVSGSSGASSSLDFTTLKKVSIGKLSFINTGAAITDLNANSEMRCLNIDGIIGSNLMRKAVWEFDYKNQQITITNSADSLEKHAHSKTIPFSNDMVGTPKIDLDINGQKEEGVIVDLGSTGGFAVSRATYAKLLENKRLSSSVFGYGTSSSGIYAAAPNDTVKTGISPVISLGDLILKNQVLHTSNNKTLGTRFLRNYRVVLDWATNHITLTENTRFENTVFEHLGFRKKLQGDKLIIGFIYDQSAAQKAGLKLGDQIVAMNGKDYTKVNPDEWCELVEQRINDKEASSLSLIILRKGKKLKYNLNKTNLLAK